MRNPILFVTLGAVVAAAVVAVGGFLAIAGTVKMFVWVGVEGVVAYWGFLLAAMVALMCKMSR